MTKTHIITRINTILEILKTAKQYLNDSYDILILDSPDEDLIIRPNKFFIRTQRAFWALAIIETHKIFGGNNDYFTIEKLFQYIESSIKEYEPQICITREKFQELSAILNSQEVKTNIKKIKELRNKHYAHRDKQPKQGACEIGLYYDHIDKLIKIGENMCIELKTLILEKEYSLMPIDVSSCKGLIHDLVDYERMKRDEMIKKLL